ncbi:MAG: hypothetical protein E7115_03235 [Bacteroidales bacterium]|nr:hypothetical protein [Bacteroidales bacterium]
MRRLFIHIIIGIGILLAGLNSCAPEPPTVVPWFVMPEPDVYSTSCRLTAYVPEEVAGDFDLGFYLGPSPDNMERYPSTGFHHPLSLTVYIDNLTKDTEYYYKAYASNGVSEVCSEICTFRTLAFY